MSAYKYIHTHFYASVYPYQPTLNIYFIKLTYTLLEYHMKRLELPLFTNHKFVHEQFVLMALVYFVGSRWQLGYH